ncbi:hypothetical protein D9V28_09100 [Mycetocola zhadangensis]|uniref:Uncharacterized protein n=2 Tax=Mycetocola zhadangensis TaxID=1164595 RepID=A0A3L7J1L8_9MICO|nr:hypothetical protein D9V28_09100 [Mycetocola zhadangensis]
MALAALGAGLVHLAVAAGSPLVAAVLVGAVGIGELGWGLAILSRGRVLTPTVALIGSLAPVALWGLLMTVRVAGGLSATTDWVPVGPLAAASLLSLSVAVVLSVDRRRRKTGGRAGPPARTATRPGRFLLGMLLGAMAVAGLVTPALAATNAGTYAVPHGEHSTVPAGNELNSPGPGTHSAH